ncbi:MAG: hypothetical protein WDO72_08880 [Pseudomonadota bacterium]
MAGCQRKIAVYRESERLYLVEHELVSILILKPDPPGAASGAGGNPEIAEPMMKIDAALP